MSNYMTFQVSSHLKNIIGKDLITNPFTAIYELTKNSLDANATDILIEIKEDKIIISDNGHGMNTSDIEYKWLFIGYSEKKESDKMFAGNKGIGRFAADNLGKSLRIETKKSNEPGIVMDINWEKFEENQSNQIDKIKIPYHQSKNLKNGTKLTITDLREHIWDAKNIKKLKDYLSKLKNPFEQNGIIKIELKTGYPEYNGLVANNLLDTLEQKSIHLNVNIEGNQITTELKHNLNKVVKFSYTNKTNLANIKIDIFHLSQAGKVYFTSTMGTEFTNYGNIFVYKNGYRVLPYGETNVDIFSINLRKSQGYNRYLGTRDIIGCISILDNKNKFQEASSRDGGFLENFSYVELKGIFLEYLRFLEDFMKLTLFNKITNYKITPDIIKRFRKMENLSYTLGINSNKTTPKEIIKKIESDKPISKDEKKYLKEVTKFTEQKSQILQKELEKKEIKITNLHRENKEKDKLLKERYQDKTLFKNIENEGLFNSQVFTHHINSLVNEFEAILYKVKEKCPIVKSDKELINIEEAYIMNVSKMKAFKKMMLNIDENINTSSTVKGNIIVFIKKYFNTQNLIDVDVNSAIENEEKYIMEYDMLKLIIILDNLLENARNFRAKKVVIIIEDGNDNLIIRYISKGSLSNKMDVNKIFSYGYSTRKRGTGNGLFMVKRIIENDFNGSIDYEEHKADFILKLTLKGV